MEHADDLVDALLEDWQAGMGGLDGQTPGLATGGLLVDARHLDQGTHAVGDPGLGEVEQALDHLLLHRLDVAIAGGGHFQHGDDLLAHGEGIALGAADQLGQELGDQAEEDQDGPEEDGEETQGEDDDGGEGVGALLEDALGHDLAEDPDEGGRQHHRQPTALITEKMDHQGRDHGGVGDHGDVGTHQGGGEQPLGFLQHGQGQLGALGALGGLVAQLDLIGADHADLGAGEKAFQQEAEQDDEQGGGDVHEA